MNDGKRLPYSVRVGIFRRHGPGPDRENHHRLPAGRLRFSRPKSRRRLSCFAILPPERRAGGSRSISEGALPPFTSNPRENACTWARSTRAASRRPMQLPKLTPQQAAAHTWMPGCRDLGRHQEAVGRRTPPPSPSPGSAPAVRCSSGRVRIRTSQRSGGRAHLLSRRAADAFGDGEGRHQAAGAGCHSADPVGDCATSPNRAAAWC